MKHEEVGLINVFWGENISSLKDSKVQSSLGSLELIDSHSELFFPEHMIVGNIRGCACSFLLPLSRALPTSPRKEEF